MAWKTPTLARVVNGWSMNTDTMGVYGNYYLKRAIVANSASAPTCPRTRSIRSTSPTTTGSRSTARTPTRSTSTRASMPPGDGFWSITLYDTHGFQVANPLDRFAVSSWMPFEDPDGSLTSTCRTPIPAPTRRRTGCPPRRARST